MPTDTERIDWLAKRNGSGLLSDDAGRWAITGDGMQNVPSDEASDIMTSFFVEAKDWYPSVREAIDAAMQRESVSQFVVAAAQP